MARLNENENENESSGGNRDGLFAGARYNTYKILKQAFVTLPGAEIARAPHIKKFQEMGGWDAENKGWVYIREVIELKKDWFTVLQGVAKDTWTGWDVANPKRPVARLEPALLDIIDAAGEREDRFAEILHQRDAEGCITYWLGMLGIEPGKHPHTYQLIRVARKLGEMIVMCLKADLDAARPSQICPAIIPAFDPPRTATYPAGHALQSYLSSYFLLRVMPGMESQQSNKPTTWEEQHNGLFALARRVADNRVIAGVHFDIDNEAGFFIAKEIDKWFGEWESTPPSAFKKFKDLLQDAKGEFPQWAEKPESRQRNRRSAGKKAAA